MEDAGRKILKESGAERWVGVEIAQWNAPVYRQEKRGRPGPATRYLRTPRPRFSVVARVRDTAVAADERSDGMFPLITNDKGLSLPQILEAYKFQPKLEKRFEQLKTVQAVAPVWLQNGSRIEALLFLYFLALLVHALLEREVHRGMARDQVQHLPLYPEERECRAPSSERILDVLAPLQRYRLLNQGRLTQIFEPELTALHQQILALLHVPPSIFQIAD